MNRFRFHYPFATVLTCLISGACFADEAMSISARRGEHVHRVLDKLPQGGFAIDARIDPSTKPGGNLQAVSALVLGWDDKRTKPSLRCETVPHVAFELREGSGRGFWEVWIDGENQTSAIPDPKPAGWMDNSPYQAHHVFRQRDGAYSIRITGVPDDGETILRFYVEHMDRPVAVHRVTRQLHAAPIAITSLGGQQNATNTATFDVRAQSTDAVDAKESLAPWQIVLQALDYERAELKEVKEAVDGGDTENAKKLFLQHMRERSMPRGPALNTFEMHPNYRNVADAAIHNRYGRLGWFDDFAEQWTDAAGESHSFVLPNGTINWGRDHGHLNRHFHWVALALADHETSDPRYARRFAFEVTDWVSREPFLWNRNPEVGGLNVIDGTVFRSGFMNTSNIGRRCELVWWYAYEHFRDSPEFDDDAHFAMLLGFLRQSRLIMNPTSFAVHDDGGAHISIALLQNALMLPEFKEATRWKEVALDQLDQVLKVQFQRDGSHVSLSTGYNWASIKALRHFIELMQRTGNQVPERFVQALELSYRHPMLLARSDRGQIDLNDGGWGKIADHMQQALALFPERRDFEWFASEGASGEPPSETSVYFPDAGHFVLRTGWSSNDHYLFMDAGPVGASHGKEDKLSLYVALGEHQLISSGGRGAYSGGPYAAYAGSTRGYNTVLVDDGVQARIALRQEIMTDDKSARRFTVTDAYDIASGAFIHGWHSENGHTKGRHNRTVVMVKGDRPPETTYFVVFDILRFEDKLVHDAKALFHLRRNHAAIHDTTTKIVHGWDAGASVRIMPARPHDVEVDIIRCQTEPHVQGWHVVGHRKAPMNTPAFRWKAKGTDTHAWVIVPAGPKQNWVVTSVSSFKVDDELRVSVKTADGSIAIITQNGIVGH